jgi:hypothetical protein
MPRQYKPSVVYALVDPRDLAVRYIGVTTSLKRRFAQHLHSRPTETVGPKVRAWLSDLAEHDLLPIPVKLEDVNGKTRHAREGQWIYFGRSLGWDLLNTLGGTLPVTNVEPPV